MVTGLIAAALALVAFNVWAALVAHDRARLAFLSRVMAWATLAAAVALPLAVLATYLAPEQTGPLNLRLYHLSAGRTLSERIPLDDRMLAFACALVPLAIAVWGLLSLRRLFELFAAGDIFSAATSKTLGALSLALFGFVVTAFIAQAPISYLLMRSHPEPRFVFAISIGLEDLVALFAAAVVAVIARVMSEATRVADENANFV
jgi:hypothetical protein